MRKICTWLVIAGLMVGGLTTMQPTLTVQAEDHQVLEEIGEPILPDELKERESLTTTTHEPDIFLYGSSTDKDALLDDAASDKRAPVVSYPIEITGNVNTDFNADTTYSAETPEVVTFSDYKGYLNVAYMDGEYLKIQRYGSGMSLIDQIQIPQSYTMWGNVICDSTGNYYVVWAQHDTEAKNCVTISVKKYDYKGRFLAECAYNGYDTWNSYWGTQQPFRAGNCSMTINNGVLAVNYARNMYSGHQSNYIIYIDCATMADLGGENAYCSHSFDQRIISLSDGGYLALNHGDAYPRSFTITKIDADRNYVKEVDNFHFREGANRDHGYNETYAQLGGIVETDNAYIFCGSSERTLSVETAPTDKMYLGHSEARDLFLQFYNKDISRTACRVTGSTRIATGTKPDRSSVLTELFLSGSEVDYGVVWLTDYEDTHFVANPKIVSIGNGQVAVLWEKRTYADYDKVETYYAVLDEDGNVIKQPLGLPGVYLAGNIDPIYQNGKICWATSDVNGGYIHVLDPFESAKTWTKVTGVKLESSQLIINMGEPVQLKASVTPSNATNQDLRYSSDNPWVVSVDQTGKITPIRTGNATITVTSGENSDFVATCEVTVIQPVTKISFEESEVTMEVGEWNSIHYEVEPTDATNKELEWSVSDESVVSITTSYPYWMAIDLEGLKPGTSTITAIAKDGSGVKASFTVTVTKPNDGSGSDSFYGTGWFANYEGYDFYRNEDMNVRCYDNAGNEVINEFKCDGTYTYYFQADGTAMKDRLTYHPDGEHVIYFDEYGHEVFSNFANVKKTIAGEDVDDYCFFDVYGYLYVDVVTYDQTGTYLYYANPYGVMERGKWFEFSDNVKWADGTPFDKAGGKYGYANLDGTLVTNHGTYDWEGRFCYLQGNGVARYLN